MPSQNFRSHWRTNTHEKRKIYTRTYAQRDLRKTKHGSPTCQAQKYHFTSTRRPKVKKAQNIQGHFTPLVGGIKWYTTWKSIWQFLITLHDT